MYVCGKAQPFPLASLPILSSLFLPLPPSPSSSFPCLPPPTWNQVLELACARESDKVYDAGGLPAATSLLIHHASSLHRDTVQSCMNMVTRLVPRVEPKDSALDGCVSSLSQLLQNSEPHVSDPTLKCFMMLADRFIRRGRDPAPIAEKGLLPELIGRLKSLNVAGSGSGGTSSSASSTSGPVGTTPERPSGHTVTTIVSLLSTLCRGSPTVTNVSSLSYSRVCWQEVVKVYTSSFKTSRIMLSMLLHGYLSGYYDYHSFTLFFQVKTCLLSIFCEC